MIDSTPSSSAPGHSASSSGQPTPADDAGGAIGGQVGAALASSDSGRPFWKWAIAYLLFWFIVTALHEYGGNAQDIGSGFAMLVLTTVLLTKGGAAMTNAVALFQNA